MTHMTSFATSSKSDLFREHPTCFNPSRPIIPFSEWCQQCTPNVFKNYAKRAALRKCSVFFVAPESCRTWQKSDFMWGFHEVGLNFISIVAVFFSLFSDTEDKNRIGIWGDIIIIRNPIFTMHRLSLQPRLQMQRIMSLSSRFAWKQWRKRTTDKHLAAAPCHPCGCCRPCATMYQYLQYGHLHFILSASF